MEHEVLWAHPVAVLAIPAFVPVVAIVVTILWIARKDRLAEAAEAGEAPALEGPALEGPDEATSATPVDVEPRRSWRDRMPRLVIGDED
jgi:hypothetical protein